MKRILLNRWVIGVLAVTRLLEHTGWNKTKAAKLLGIKI